MSWDAALELDALFESGSEAPEAPAAARIAPAEFSAVWRDAVSVLPDDEDGGDAAPHPAWADALDGLGPGSDDDSDEGPPANVVDGPGEGALVLRPVPDNAVSVHDAQHADPTTLAATAEKTMGNLHALCQRVPDAAFDPVVFDLTNSFFSSEPLVSHAAAASVHTVTHQTLAEVRELHASLGIEFERWAWRQATEKLVEDTEVALHTVCNHEL